MKAVRICPDKDAACGDREINWCEGCPKRKSKQAQPAQGPAIPSTQDAASKVGPFWQEFSVVYEAIAKQQITIREIAWLCFLAAKMTTQPAQEPVDWEQIYWDMVNAMLRDKLRAQPAQEPVGEVTENTDNGFKCEFNQRLTAGTKLYTTPPQRPWVGLTEKEKKEIYRLSVYVEGAISLTEAKLKEKNNGT